MNQREPSIAAAVDELNHVRNKIVAADDASDVAMSDLESLAAVFVDLLAEVGVTWDDFQQHADTLERTGHTFEDECERLHHIFTYTLDPEYLAASHALRDLIQWPIEQEQKQRLNNEMERDAKQSWLDDTP